MPVIGTSDNSKLSRIALEDLNDHLEEILEAKSKGWTFTVHRDEDGFIKTVEAEPKTNATT